MPSEAGYQQRTTPQDPAAMPLPTPASQGAAIGAGLSDFGDAINATQLQAYKLQRSLQADQQASTFDNNFTNIRQGMDQVVATARDAAPPGAPGHTATVMDALNAQKDQLFSGITDLKVQQHAQAQWDSYAANLQGTETAWQNGQQVGKMVADNALATQASANRAQTSGDPAVWQQEMSQRHAAIDALTGVPGDTRDKMAAEATQDITTGYLRGQINKDPASVIDAIDQGKFNDLLKNEQLEVLRKSAEVEQHKQEVAANQKNTVAQKQLDKDFETAKAKSAGGIDVSADLPDLAARAKVLGDTTKLAELQNLAAQSQFSKVWTIATPVQRQQQIDTLAAVQNPSDAQQMELHWLREKTPALDAQFDRDPAGFLMANGHQAPPLTDGAGRWQWSQAMTNAAVKAGGAPVPPLTQQEAHSLQTLKASGLQGSNQTLATLDQFPGGAPRAAAAKQVAPEDLVFQHVAQLDPNARGTVQAGAEVLSANPQFFGPKPHVTATGTMTSASNAETIMTAADARLRIALKLIDPKQADGVSTVARQFIAGVTNHLGQGAAAVSERNYDTAQRVALGGKIVNNVAFGGLGDFGGTPVILPDGSTSGSFANGVRNFLTQHKPVNPDGSALNVSALHPVFTGADPHGGGNNYVFEAPDGRLAADAKHKTITATFRGTYGR
jgi:hypothetical protein